MCKSFINGDALFLLVRFHFRGRETAVRSAGSNCLPHTIQAVLNMNKEKLPKYNRTEIEYAHARQSTQTFSANTHKNTQIQISFSALQ